MAKQKKKRSPAARRVRWILGTIFRALVTVFLVCVITGCIVGCVLTVYILDYVGTLEDIDIRNIDLNYTSIIYANDDEGNPYELSRIHGDENRIWVDYEQMPSYLTDVTIATEDKRFLELAGAYQIDANGGTYTKPTSYTRVYDRENSLLLEADTTATRVISKETSSILNLMMQQVVSTAPGTGTAARFTGDLAGMPVAGKTGTSSDNKDQWFVGITPYYIGVTWMGYAPVAQPINYIQFPTPIVWRNVMQPIHEGLPVIDFDYSQNIVQKQYCVETGDLATEDCPSQLMGWYKTTNIPDVCTEHVGVKDSEEEEDDDGSRSSSKKSSSKKSSSSSRAGNTRSRD